MATYGKKGKPILPPFSVLRDSDPNLASKPEKGQFTRQGSTATLSVLHNSGNESRTSHHDDSVEEMASILLNDTTIVQSSTGPSTGLPQFDLPKGVLSITTQEAPMNENSTPPSALVFTGEGTSLPNRPPVVTAPRNSDSCTSDELDDASTNISKRPASYTRKAPILLVSRRVSKRKSAQPNSTISSPTNLINSQSHVTSSTSRMARSISTPNHLLINSEVRTSSSADAEDINGKVQGMLAATNSLKHAKRPVVSTKKRLRDSTVLVRVKSVLSSHLSAVNSKFIHDSARDDRLLDSALDPPSRPTSLEIRINEGDNFNKKKVPQITGHGKVKRKPVTSDTRSLKSRVSLDDLSYGGCSSGNEHGIPTVSKLPRSLTDLAQFKGNTPSLIKDQVDFDPTFSSSPIAQSTPRIRLQLTTSKDGKETQNSTPDNADYLFNSNISLPTDHSDMDIDTELVNKAKSSTSDMVKRKGTEPKVFRGRLRSHSRKWKKHPSPSKSELEHLERAFLNHYPNLRQSECITSGGGLPHSPPNQFSTKPVLTAKDPNEGVITSQSQKKAKKGSSLSEKTWLTRTTESMPDINKGRKAQRISLVPKLPKPSKSTRSNREPGKSPRDNTMGGSDMEIDELQLDDPAFDIAMKP